MKVVQTFCTKNLDPTNNKLAFKCGWRSPEYHWMSWALSCLQLKKLFGSVHLVTDLMGKEILIDTLKFPFSSVDTSLEGQVTKYPKELFSLSKIYSYSVQTTPFIHFDSDVFMYKRMDEDLLGAALISSNLEVNMFYNTNILREVDQKFEYLPEDLKGVSKHANIYACNAGIIGGNDLLFFKEYCLEAFAFIDKNKKYLGLVETAALNFLFEQCMFYYMAKKRGIPVTYFMKEIVDHPLFVDYARFADIPNTPMIHTVGGFKRSQFICDHLSKRLRLDYPEWYYWIIDQTKKNDIELRSSVYNQVKVSYRSQKADLEQIPPQQSFDLQKEELQYRRTIGALDKIGIAYPISNLNGGLVVRLVSAIGRIRNKQTKDCVEEVLRLETKKSSLVNIWNDFSSIKSAYENDVSRYQKITEKYKLELGQLLKQRVHLNDQIVLLELRWNWRCSSTEELQNILDRNFNTAGEYLLVALVPNVLRLDVNEEYQEQLESIIIGICKNEISITEIIETVKGYFDEEELNEKYESYRSLILDTLKRLLFSDVLLFR